MVTLHGNIFMIQFSEKYNPKIFGPMTGCKSNVDQEE
jgi:hypothetical protein